jgi:hypothetical protein
MGSNHSIAVAVEDLLHHAVHVPFQDAAPSEFRPILPLFQKGCATQDLSGSHDGVLEGLILERMQRIVVDEDTDGALGREQVGRMLERRAK